MNINVLQSNNPYFQNVRRTKVAVKNTDKVQKTKLPTVSSNNVISKSERQYFAKLFPENSVQIEKHILFNRKGKLHSVNLNTGVLFDKKI